jgi:hypothetical protein
VLKISHNWDVPGSGSTGAFLSSALGGAELSWRSGSFTPIPVWYEAGCFPKYTFTRWRREKLPSSAGNTSITWRVFVIFAPADATHHAEWFKLSWRGEDHVVPRICRRIFCAAHEPNLSVYSVQGRFSPQLQFRSGCQGKNTHRNEFVSLVVACLLAHKQLCLPWFTRYFFYVNGWFYSWCQDGQLPRRWKLWR